MKKKKNKKKSYVKRCLPYFLKDKKSLILLLVGGLLLAAVSTFVPAVTGYALDYVTKGEYRLGITVIGITLGLWMFQSILEVVLERAFVKLQNIVVSSMKMDVINAYFKIKTSKINSESSGIFLSRIISDPNKVFSAFNNIRHNINNILSNIFVVFYISYINLILGVISLIGILLVYVIERHSMAIYTKNKKAIEKEEEVNTGILTEATRGIRDIKFLNISSYFKNKAGQRIEKVNDMNYNATKTDMWYYLLRDFTTSFFLATLIFIAIYMTKLGIIETSAVVVLFMYRNRIFEAILYIAWSERRIKELNLAAGRIFEVIDSKKYEKEEYGTKRVENLKGDIEFKRVKFSYAKDPTIKGISFHIKPKETVAIVGKSGSGKSTIINLITKMYDADSGNIYLDGYKIDTLDKYTLRKNIAVISQNPYIFNMTINENLMMVNPNANKKQIENVCKICEIHDFIMNLPKKYNTLIGEGGVNLSGGERQRLAIARALLMKTNIILFDEATSALDNETQSAIQKAINNISSEYTMIIIAHRLSTIKDCNRILVVDEGKIIGDGKHSYLYKTNDVYKKLYENELLKNDKK